jgi:flagellar hook-length control protein FliK
VPRVASETSALLHPLHNATVRHRALGNGSGDATSPFALLVDSADAAPAKEPRRSGNRGSDPHPQGSPAPSSQPTDQSPQTPATADPAAGGASDAAPDATQASTQSQPADGTEGDAPVVAKIDDPTQGDPLDPSVAAAANNSTAPQPVPTPPAVVVNGNVNVDVVPAAQGSQEGESTAPVAAVAAPANPATQVANPDTSLPGNQPTTDNQSAAPAQAAPPPAAGANEFTPAGDAKPPDQQGAATQALSDPAPPQTGKPDADQAASKPATPTDPQPIATRPDAPLLATVKQPTTTQASPPVAERKSEAATDAEDDGGKPTDSTHLAETAADRPIHGVQRTHADVPAVDDKERLPLGTETHDAAQSGKLPTEAVHAVLLANDQAATAVAQPASTAGNENSQPAIPIAGLAVEIAARAQDGQSRFEIRLDPPDLGRIDVRLDIDSSGQVTSRLVVDRPETLDQLRRDSAGLERALQDAGLKTAQNGLQFSLRDQGFAGRDDNSPSSNAARLLVPDPDLAPVEVPANAYGRAMRTGGVDIRV